MARKVREQKISTIILGVGNPILKDDSVGIKVAKWLKERVPSVEVVETAEAGLTLLDFATGQDRLIILDSIKAGENGAVGEVFKLDFTTLDPAMDFTSFHGVDIVTAFELGRKLGYEMPKQVSVYAITVRDNLSFDVNCSEELEKRIPAIAMEILEEERL